MPSTCSWVYVVHIDFGKVNAFGIVKQKYVLQLVHITIVLSNFHHNVIWVSLRAFIYCIYKIQQRIQILLKYVVRRKCLQKIYSQQNRDSVNAQKAEKYRSCKCCWRAYNVSWRSQVGLSVAKTWHILWKMNMWFNGYFKELWW